MRQQVKRVVAIIMTVAMLVGLFPLEVFAQNSQRAADPTQTLTTSVDYDSAERATATVTYHKEAQTAPACNIVFLLDASRQGGSATAQFKKMIGDNVWSLISGTRASMQVISYTQTPVLRENTNGSVVGSADGLNGLVDGIATGDGTADEVAALEQAFDTVNDINNENPTIVFWVLGDHFGNENADAVEDALKSLDDALGANDALIAWQLADEPNDLIADYATSYTTAENENTSAAYADNDAETFRSGMLDSLERVLHDHYRDTSVTLSLTDGQSLATKITDAEWKPANENILPKVTTEVATDGKSVTVKFDKLCANLSGDLVLTLDLDTNINKKETVLAAATAKGYYSGLFDEKTENEPTLSFPAVEIDRSLYTISFDEGEADGTAPEKITAMPGQFVTIPDDSGLSNSGSSFGGWNDEDSNHYSAGQIIAMPAENLNLTPAWGHVEVELELGDVRYAEANGNQMASNAKYSSNGLLNFDNVTIEGGNPFANGSIHSLQVIDQELSYDTVPDSGDKNQVKITTEGIDAVYARHVGATNDDRVVAYLRKCQCEPKEENKYDLIIAGPGGVVAPANMEYWMQGNKSLITADLTGLKMSQVTTMFRMFADCTAMTSVNFDENIDTSNVTSMYDVFSNCQSLTTIENLDKFDTSKVTTMMGMFWQCFSITRLDLSSFNTAHVTAMPGMFTDCKNLTNITFSEKFDTGKVTEMYSMFSGCRSLTSLDLPKSFNTSSLKNATHMFQNCTSLTSLTLPKRFDTSNATEMQYMFYGCTSLTSLTLPERFDTSNATEMQYMFYGCTSLTSLTLPESFDTSNVNNMEGMFYKCSSLENLELPESFNTSNVVNMSRMFQACSSLTDLTLPKAFDTSKVENMRAMFADNTKLETVDLSRANFKPSSATTMEYLFSADKALKVVKLGKQFYLQNVQNLGYMFNACLALEEIDGNFIFSATEDNQATTMSHMFYQCYKLKAVNFTYADENGKLVENEPASVSFSMLKTMANMFDDCNALTSIDMGGWKMPDLTSTAYMFYDCDDLMELDLSWTGIAAISGDGTSEYTTTQMFGSGNDKINQSAKLYVASEDGNGAFSIFMQAVIEAFKASVTNGTVYVDGALLTDQTTGDEPTGDGPMAEPSGGPTPGTEPEGTPADPENGGEPGNTNEPSNEEQNNNEPSNEEQNNNEPSNDEQNDNEPTNEEPSGDNVTPGGEGAVSTDPVEEPGTDDPKQDATEPAADAVSPLALSRSGSTPVVQADDGEKNYTVNGNIWTHKQATPAGSEFQYRVRVKYVGDVGAQSGEIKVTFPIPDDVRVLTEAELNEIGAGTKLVQAGSVKETDGADSGDFMGGRVVDAHYDADANALTATIDGLFTGTEVEISIWCENETKIFPQGGGYVYWDGSATAQDSAALVSSNIYRLWDQRGAGENPPSKTEYTLTYQFAGEVPPDAAELLPAQESYASGAQATVADVQESSYGYYEFMGWKDQDGTSYTAGDSITMKKDITLTGTWKLNESKAPTITVNYAYSGNVPTGAPVIGADGQIQPSQQITVGKTHTVVANLTDVDYSSFNGWVPSLSVGGKDVSLINDAGTYTGEGYRIPTSGPLSTEQFRGKEDVVVTYTGSWTPYTGTIKFNANADGVEGSMTDMPDVAHDTQATLTPNAFTRDGYTFEGWSLEPNGLVVKSDGDLAAGLITRDKQEVTLYAQWEKTPEVVETVTLRPEDQTIYTGGKEGSGEDEEFPHPIYLLNGQALDKKTTFKVDGVAWDTSKGGYPFTVKYYDDADNEITDDETYGDYTAKIVAVDDVDLDKVTTADGKALTLRDGTLRIRYVSNATEASENALTSDAEIYSANNAEAVRDKVEATAEAGVILPENTTICLNGDEDYPYSKLDANAPYQIALLFDDLLPRTGGTSQDYADQLLAHAAEKNHDVAGKESEVKYLDLVDVNNSNAWVSSSKGSDVFWPYPSDTGEDTDFTLLHFKGLHREYGMDGEEDLNAQIEASEVEAVKIEQTEEGIWFHVGASGFSPFALLWDEDHNTPSVTPDPEPDDPEPDEPDTPDDLNTVDHFSYVVGYEDGTVMPQKQITRAEVATIFYRLLKEDVRDENTTDVSDFSDVSSSDWYGTTVATLADMGIVKGYEDGTFRPNAPITRAEFAAIATRFFDETGATYEPGTFTDVTGDEWFAGAIMDAVNLGLIGGYEDGTVRPNNNITRAEACAIVNRTLGRVPDADHLLPEDEMKTWPDNPESAWFYADMQEATNGHEYEWITEDGNKIENWTDLLDKEWNDR